MLEHVVGNADEGVFLAEHVAGFADESEAVDVGVDDDAEVAVVLAHAVGDLREVLRYGLGVVGEVAGGVAVELDDVVDAEGAEEARDGDATGGVDGVDGDLEVRLAYGVGVDEFEREDALDMAVDFVVEGGDVAEVVDVGVEEVGRLGEAEDFLAFGVGDEFAAGVEELECVPVLGVVAGGDDDAAVAMVVDDAHLGGGSGGEAGFEDVDAASHEGADDEAVDHGAGEAGVATDGEAEAPAGVGVFEEGGEGGGELDDVEGAETLAGASADGAADAGNGFDEAHIGWVVYFCFNSRLTAE